MRDGDVVVVAQKAVSKVEGRIVRLDSVEPTQQARQLAGPDGDPRQLEVILGESARIVRSRPPLVIAETRHGYVCASAGVDASNAPGAGARASTRRSRCVGAPPPRPSVGAGRCGRRGDRGDSFGRPWRQGTVDVALGIAGVTALQDLRGRRDAAGYELRTTQIAVADEIASAAELVLGKTDNVPAAIVRGVNVRGDGGGADLVMPAERDLFR